VPTPAPSKTVITNGSTMTSKRVSRRERRTLILEAAREEFLASGYSGARTRDIAERAGVAEALLYRHFASKEALFEEAVVAPLEAWLELLPDYAATIVETTEDLERREVTQRSNEQLLRTTLQITPLLGIVLFASAEQGRNFYLERFVPFLEGGIAATTSSLKGWARPEVDPTVLMMSVMGTYLAYAIDSHFRGVEIDVSKIAGQVTDLIFDGIVSPQRPGRIR
jgi:TetR/AcrR family transcriptional regulator